jgi:hypothetical protein
MAKRKSKRPIKCNTADQRYTVVRVNGDAHDTHAGRSFEAAMRSAQPDRGAKIDVFRTCASDAGAARLPSNYRSKGVLVRSFSYKGR